MTKIVIYKAGEKTGYVSAETARQMVTAWIASMQPVIKYLAGRPKKAPCRTANTDKAIPNKPIYKITHRLTSRQAVQRKDENHEL